MPRPHPPSDTLTSITPPSLVDDTLSLSRRMPRRPDPSTITTWLNDTPAPPVLPPPASAISDSEAYTGSFFDDGADMRYPSEREKIPGFGALDRRFYSKGTPTKTPGREEEEWTVEKERALAGDMFRSLARLKSVARVAMKDPDEAERRHARKERKEGRVGAVEGDGRVRIMKPIKWGTFVIEGEKGSGRVVVVDGGVVYDSGGKEEWEAERAREREYQERKERRKAKEKEKREKEAKARLKAEEEAKKLKKREEEMEKEMMRAASKEKQGDKHRRHRHHSSPVKPLKSIPEADSTEESASSGVSPTKFFVTGAKSGWPSPVPSIAKPAAAPSSSSRLLAPLSPAPQLSPTKSVPSVGSILVATVHSTITSVTKSEESWTEGQRGRKSISVVKALSSVSSERYSDATASTTTATGAQNPRIVDVSELLARSSPRRAPSASRPRRGSIHSPRKDTDNQSARGLSKRPTSTSRSKTSSLRSPRKGSDKDSARGSTNRGRTREGSGLGSYQDWNLEPQPASVRSSSKRAQSLARSGTCSNDGWKQDVDAFISRLSHKTSPRTRSPMASVSAWIQSSGHATPIPAHSPTKSAASKRSAVKDYSLTASIHSQHSAPSQTSAITPYSWRRQVEELSDHSTVGSPTSPPRLPSPIPSLDRGSDGEAPQEQEPENDTHSIKSHSTYRAPTVEDVPDDEEGAQEWDFAWSVKDSVYENEKKGSGVGSAKWSGKTGWGGDVVPEDNAAEQWNLGNAGGAVEGEWQDKSGFDEENETWLNAEVGGVKYREAEWRVEPPAGSWRDV